ncbi:hypothetical protein RZS08_63925, partial [Arthrospira platensis SPKY1]|nr:hypothetical protein [Arthrospira platensis SPKY1]
LLPEQQQGIPHWNLGVLHPTEKESAAAFLQRLKQWFPDWSPNQPSMVYVGGSTLHAQALLFGLDAMPTARLEFLAELEVRWQRDGPEALMHLLRQVDPDYA